MKTKFIITTAAYAAIGQGLLRCVPGYEAGSHAGIGLLILGYTSTAIAAVQVIATACVILDPARAKQEGGAK